MDVDIEVSIPEGDSSSCTDETTTEFQFKATGEFINAYEGWALDEKIHGFQLRTTQRVL